MYISKDLLDKIINHARESIPIEACGIIAGLNDHAKKVYKMKNIDNSGEHFMMAVEEQFKVIKDIRNHGLEMLAIYHSHPATPARPSKEDIRLALTPVVYIIVSLMDLKKPEIRGYKINENKVKEIPIITGDEEK